MKIGQTQKKIPSFFTLFLVMILLIVSGSYTKKMVATLEHKSAIHQLAEAFLGNSPARCVITHKSLNYTTIYWITKDAIRIEGPDPKSGKNITSIYKDGMLYSFEPESNKGVIVPFNSLSTVIPSSSSEKSLSKEFTAKYYDVSCENIENIEAITKIPETVEFVDSEDLEKSDIQEDSTESSSDKNQEEIGALEELISP